MHQEEPQLTVNSFLPDIRKSGESPLNNLHTLVGSGKSAISLILKFLRLRGDLKNKMEEVLCPSWMGTWIYATMVQQSFPVTLISDRTKVIYVYHQYGFLQDINYLQDFATDKKLTIIEDSAHLLSLEAGKLSFRKIGEFSLHSPPKFIPVCPVGIIESENQEFNNFLEVEIQGSSKIAALRNSSMRYYLDKKLAGPGLNSKTTSLRLAQLYSTYPFTHHTTGFARRGIPKLVEEFEIRKMRLDAIYSQLPEEYLPARNTLSREIVPFKVPVFLPSRAIEATKGGKFRHEVNLGVVHFDKNQNMLKPDYSEVILIDFHSGMPETQFNRNLEIISSLIK